MRPLLVSLALLLLALCRSASTGATITWDDSIYTADRHCSGYTTRDAQLAKLIADKTKYAALAPIMGNSLHALMLKGAGKFDALPDYYKKALVNGVRCEVAEADIDKKIANAQYGVDTIPIDDAERTKEETLAKALTPSIDCTVRTASICFCVARLPLLVCLANKIAGADAPGTCRKAAVAELTDKGKKALGPALEALTKISLPNTRTTVDDLLKVLTVPPTLAGIYCDAIDNDVISAVEKLYAVDALYWTADGPELLALGNANVLELCKNAQVKVSPLGTCLCDKKVGLLTCYGAAFGKTFKDAAYLDCAATPAKFDETKKDAAVAAIAALTPQPNPAPGPGAPTAAPPAKETTTAATGGAATSSSLLLAPLAAAAASLLLL